MRRLKQSREKERGAAGVLVALMMLVLIGAGAMAVDVGQIYAERAQLQNAADAGALSAAQQCHKAGTCSVSQATTWAQALAGPNSNDGASDVASVDLSVPKQVTVVTTTRNGTNAFLTKMFANALNAPPVTVGAHATASFFPPGSGSGFPLALSNNCFNLTAASPTGQVQKISYKPGAHAQAPRELRFPAAGGGWTRMRPVRP